MNPCNILVVEDESLVALDIEQGLTKLGCRVMGVLDTGEAAVRKAIELKPDLIFMDIGLKGAMDGIQAAVKIKDQARIPIIFLTAFSDEGTLQRAKIGEPFGYILKPFEHAELRVAIELALHRAKLDAPQKHEDGTRPSALPRFIEAEAPGAAFQRTNGKKRSAFDVLRRVQVFSVAPDRALQTLADSARFCPISAGKYMLHEGDERLASFVIVSGRVALVKTSVSGKDLIVELLPPGDLVALSLGSDSTSIPLSARAQTQSEVLWLTDSALMSLLDEFPEIYRELLKQSAARLEGSYNMARGLAHDSVEVRIASTITALVPKFANQSGDDDAYTIYITRQEIADLTGTTPETAIRTTKAMERDHMLDLSKPGRIKVTDLERIAGIAEG